MKSRARVLALGMAAVLMMLPSTVQAGGKDAKGPACVDILDNPAFGFNAARTLITLEVDLADLQCANGTYEAVIWTQTQGAIPATRSSVRIDDPTIIVYEWDFNPSYWGERLCAEASTRWANHVADYSPDRLDSGGPRTDATGQCIDQTNPDSPRTSYG